MPISTSNFNKYLSWCDFPPDAFDDLVGANQSLGDVTIHFYGDHPEKLREKSAMERFAEIIRCFMKSPAHHTLHIDYADDEHWPEDVSTEFFEPVLEMLDTLYRHRKVHIIILGWELETVYS